MKPTTFVAMFVGLALVPVALESAAQASPKMPAVQVPIALKGHCPVSITRDKKWIAGKTEHSVVYDGHAYLFPAEKQKQEFLADPGRFVPALHGDCVICFAEQDGRRTAGSIKHAAFYKSRLYLFPTPQLMTMFVESPEKFADKDVAYDGLCAVCLIDAHRDIPGSAQYTDVFAGRRYLFPNQQTLAIFRAHPEKYAVKEEKRQIAAAPGEFETFVSVTGKSGCAVCDYGVHPRLDPGRLGFAVKSSDGKIYVIEKMHELDPKLYEDRFEGLQVTVTGTEVAREGDVIWLKAKEVHPIQ